LEAGVGVEGDDAELVVVEPLNHRARRRVHYEVWTAHMVLQHAVRCAALEDELGRALYGPVAIREIYGATEGMFGQQRDERRAWVPNYDLFFFEVETRRGLIMLHEMRPGETGSLVVSTAILPRYKIGDLILAFDAPYFRCIGRDQRFTRLRYAWDQISRLDFGGP